MVSESLKNALNQLMKIEELSNFRLVGGTNLALQLGHRSSIDIDLFAGGGAPNPRELSSILDTALKPDFKISRVQQYGLSATVNQVKVDLYDWKVPFYLPAILVDNIRLSSLEDIFAFKCEALTGRRVEKDFVDLAEIMLHRSLDELFKAFQVRYPYFSKGAALAILLKPESFERDFSIRYSMGKSWDKYVEIMEEKIIGYEKEIQSKKKEGLHQRDAHIQKLVDLKRKKENP